MRTLLFVSALTLLTLVPALPAVAHGGGLSVEGYLNDRKHGGYHFHRGATAERSSSAKRTLSSAGGASFGDCSAARVAGTPVREGALSYSRRNDGDGDGGGCE